MAKVVDVVKGSADEQILKKQYGDNVAFNYTDRNQFVGSDRGATNQKYQDILGKPINDAGDLNQYSGVKIVDGYDSTPRQQVQKIQQPVQDNSAMIKQMFDEQKAATVAQLKQAILNSKKQYNDTIASTPGTYDKLRNTVQSNFNNATGEYQKVIDNAPGQYQPLRDQVSAAGYKNLDSLREMLANQGQQGGVNRTEETQVNTATENGINQLNQQQQGTINDAQSSINALNKDKELKLAGLATQQQQVIDQANRAIADLEASGSLQEAQAVAQNASDKIRALIDEGNRVQAATYQMSQDAIKNAQVDAGITGVYNGDKTLAARNADTQNAQNLAQLLGYTSDGTPILASRQLAQNQSQFDTNLAFQREQAANDTAYKYAALAKSGSSGGGSSGGKYYGGATTASQGKDFALSDVYGQIQSWIDAGYSYDQVRNTILSNPSDYAKVGLDPNKVADDAYDIYQASRFANGGHAAM